MLEYIRSRSLKEGDLLGRTIYDAKGMVLMRQGSRISAAAIKAINAQGFKGIYIERASSVPREQIPIQEPLIDDLTTIQVINLLTNIFKNQKIFDDPWDKTFVVQRKQLESYIDDFYDIFKKKNIKNKLLFDMEDGRTIDNWLMYHSFNTAQIAMGIGIRMGYSEEIVKGLGFAGFFHDLGKAKYPNLMNKKELSSAEVEIIRNHPRDIFDVLKGLTGYCASPSCIYGCWQSHELFPGGGYPMGISGDKVTPYGYIIGIASRYDNYTHYSPYNETPLETNDALERIVGGDKYPVEIRKAFADIVSPYPIGTQLLLSNEETGIVIKNTIGLPLRPVLVSNGKLLDLTDNANLSITIKSTIS